MSEKRYTGSDVFMRGIEVLAGGRSYMSNHFILAEECAELTQAASKMVRYIDERTDDRNSKKDDAGKYIELADHILEESADVLICIYTLMRIYGFSDDDLDVEVRSKMVRNLERIGKEVE